MESSFLMWKERQMTPLVEMQLKTDLEGQSLTWQSMGYGGEIMH